MQLQELLDSKIYVRENGIRFPSPKELIEPFTNQFKNTVEWKIETKDPVMNQNTDDMNLNISYPRALVEARMNSELTGFTSVVGILYSLDTGKPSVRVYTGQEVQVCMNLCIFNAEHVNTYDIMGNYQQAYEMTGKYIERKEEEQKEYEQIWNELTEISYTESEYQRTLGDILMRATRKNLVNTVTKATKSMLTKDSRYYVYPNNEFTCNGWNLYNAMTEVLNNADMVEKPLKSLHTYQMIMN